MGEALYKGEKESMGDSLSLSPLYVCSWLRGYVPVDHNIMVIITVLERSITSAM